MDRFLVLMLSIGIIVLAFAFEFLIIATCVKLICWGFGFVFSWKLVFGIWGIMVLVSAILKSGNANK